MDKRGWTIPLTLALMTLATSAILFISEQATHARIEQQKRQKLLRSLQTIAPPQRYDNDLLGSAEPIFEPEALGHRKPRTWYRGYKNGQLSLVVLPVTTHKGYAGDIRLLVAIDAANGTIIGTKILEHHETPGLGDQIEPRKSDWLQQFIGASLSRPDEKRWKVRKDGGEFDQITGATITPRAVTGAIRDALVYARTHLPQWRKQLPGQSHAPPHADNAETKRNENTP